MVIRLIKIIIIIIYIVILLIVFLPWAAIVLVYNLFTYILYGKDRVYKMMSYLMDSPNYMEDWLKRW